MFDQRLERLMRTSGIESDAELAKKIDVNRSLIGKWKTKGQLPDAKNLIKLSLFFNVSIDFLLGKSDEKSLLKNIPLLDKIPDGDPREATSFHVNEISMPADIASPYDFGYLVPNNHMENAGILRADIVFVKTDAQLKEGQIFIYSLHGIVKIGRYFREGKIHIFKEENNALKPDIVTSLAATHFRLIGKISGLWRPDLET